MISITRYIFGYDFFISYSHGDAQGYAQQLRNTLVNLGYRIFLDHEELHAGQELTRAIQASLNKSTALVVIVSPDALVRPAWIEKEVQLFSANDRTIVPVSLRTDLAEVATQSALLELLGERLRVTEAEVDGELYPSQKTVSQLAKALKGPRIERNRIRALAATALVLAGLTAIAVWFGFAEQEARFEAQQEAVAARKETASRYAVEAQAALPVNPDEALSLARRAVDVFREAGDPLVPAAVSALQEVMQDVAGEPLGAGSAVLTHNAGMLILLNQDGELTRYDQPGKFGLSRASLLSLPADFADTPRSLFLVDGEPFLSTTRRNYPEETYKGMTRSIYRLADWQHVQEIEFKSESEYRVTIESCRAGGKTAVVREDRVELLDVRHPNEIRAQLPHDLYKPLVRFSDDCAWLAVEGEGALHLINTATSKIHRFEAPKAEPVSIAVSGDSVLVLDMHTALWRLTDSAPVRIGSLYDLHADLVEAEGTPFSRSSLEGYIDIAEDGVTVLAVYKILIDEEFAGQGLGMAGVFSLTGEFTPWPVRQRNAEIFGSLDEESSSSFNDENLSSDRISIKDMSSLGVAEGRFLKANEHELVATLGFHGDLLLHGDIHERIRLAEDVSAYTISSDQRWIVTGHTNGDLKFWEPKQLEPGDNNPLFVWHGHDAPVVDIQLLPSVPLLVSRDEGRQTRFWHQAHPRLGARVHMGASPDGRFLMTADLDQNLFVWDLQAANPFAAPIDLDATPVREIAFMDSWAITLHIDSKPGSAHLRLWNLADPVPFSESRLFALQDEEWIKIAQRAYAQDPYLIPGSPWLKLFTREKEIWLAVGYNTFYRYLMAVLRLDLAADTVSLADSLVAPSEYRRIISSNRGRWLATIDEGFTVELWQFDNQSDAPISTSVEFPDRINQVEFSPEDDWLLLRSGTTARLIELATARQVDLVVPDAPLKFVKGVSQLISEHEGVLTAYELSTGQSRPLALDPVLEIQNLTVADDGRHVLVTDVDERLWWSALRSGEPAAHLMPLAPPGEAFDLTWTAFATNEDTVAATLASGELMIWYNNNAGNFSEPVIIAEPESELHDAPRIIFSADNEWVTVTVGGGHRLRPLSLKRLTASTDENHGPRLK